MRSISLYGLSDVILTFEEGTDDYFARQVVFQRIARPRFPPASRPAWRRCSAPAAWSTATCWRAPTARPQELKTIEDWVVERAYRSVHGVADDSGFGGTTMQYQVLLDPARLYGYHLTVPQVVNALTANNSNAGGGFYSQGGQFYYVRGIGLLRDTEDIGNVVVGSNNGVPDPGQGHRRRGDRPRPAPGRVRLSEERRCRRRRHPDAARRADAERAEGGGGRRPRN